MKPEDFNANETDSEEAYSQFVDWLEELTVEELKLAKGDRDAEKAASCRYFKRGYRANLTTGELIDFLGVSYPSILDRAGYSDEEALQLFEVIDVLKDEEIENESID